MKIPIGKVVRGVLAIVLLSVGLYWFFLSALAWSQEGFVIITDGDKGKTAISGLIFSITFVLYGIWEMYNLANENKT